MAVAFRAAGTVATDAAAPFSQVVGFPAGVAAGDICILIAATDVAAGGTMSISNNGSISSWTPLTGIPVSVTAGEKLYVWWGRYVSGSTGPTVDATADHLIAVMVAYSGCVPNGSPIDVSTTGTEATSDTSFSFATGLTTGENNTLCVVICTSGFDSASSQFPNAFTNANLVSCTRRATATANTTAGGGGGFSTADGILTTAGAMGTFATTLLNASPKTYIAFSLRPEVAVNVAAGVGSLTLTGFAPTVSVSDNKNVAAGVGSLALTGFSPVLDLAVNPAPGQLLLAGFAPLVSISDNKNVTPNVGQLSVDGFAPTIQTPVNNNADTGQLIVTGFAPTINITDNIAILIGFGQLVLNGYAPEIGLSIVTKTAELILSGLEPEISTIRITKQIFQFESELEESLSIEGAEFSMPFNSLVDQTINARGNETSFRFNSKPTLSI